MGVRRTVVLDGSNIVSGGAGGEDVNGHRLISAVDLYAKKGYEVVPVMKHGTYFWMRGKEIPGFDAVRRLRNSGKLRMFGKDDDLYIIQIALDLDAWIVTQDTFEDKPNGTKKERSQFPDFPWDDIDDRTWGTGRSRDGRVRANSDWSVSGPKYYHPTLPRCPSNGLIDPFSAIRERIAEVNSKLGDIDQMAEETSSPKEIKTHLRHMLKRSRKMEESLPRPRVPNAEEISTILVPGLRDILRSLGLKVSGRRAELETRILEFSTEK